MLASYKSHGATPVLLSFLAVALSCYGQSGGSSTSVAGAALDPSTAVVPHANLGLHAAAASVAVGPPTSDSDNAAIEQHIKDLEERIITLEGEVRTLKSAAAPAPAAALDTVTQPSSENAVGPAPIQQGQGAAGEVGQAPTSYGGAGGAAAKALNPDISVIGDFIGAFGGNTPPPLATIESFPSMQMHESEIGLQAIIDPYARGDFFISFGEQGVNLEEGFITFTALPQGFVAKVGKMRSSFGKVNLMHNHVLPWIDRPLVSTNLVGGEDGIDDAGLSVQRILPAPKGIFLEATAQVFRGDTPGVYKAWQNTSQ